jgi:hypothetical protein
VIEGTVGAARNVGIRHLATERAGVARGKAEITGLALPAISLASLVPKGYLTNNVATNKSTIAQRDHLVQVFNAERD